MPAVAVTSAPEAHTYVVALRGFPVGCCPVTLLIAAAAPRVGINSLAIEELKVDGSLSLQPTRVSLLAV